MKIESIGEVLARVDALGLGSTAVAAFDCDGTLWSGDVGEDLFEVQVAGELFRSEAHAAMRDEAVRHAIDPSGSASELARRLHTLESQGSFPQERLYELMAFACAGQSRDEVDALMHEVVEHGGVLGRVNPETLELLEELMVRGLSLVAVSASTLPLIERALRKLGLEADAICAATPRWSGDVMQADVERPIPYGPGKVHALRRTVGGHPLAVALGDNTFDVDMLACAAVPLAVRPKDGLVAAASRVDGIVELARK
ncbi:MAG: haloacid dehalogenase-like hydrolase [Deltaproteobacteria bacterium]|nr:haloacid dehalogenase-like hydrolase [Deltaproteobacteria bacterium]